MTPFMLRVLFRIGDGICRICNRKRQDTIYHMLNARCKTTGYYTQRHNSAVDRLEEAIRMLKKPTDEMFKNRIVRIDGRMAKNGRGIKKQIRSDI
jgi:hypothetical protein